MKCIYADQHIEWIDISKGLGMCLVMFGHAPIPGLILKYISTFHMPLFFFLSGYLFLPSKYNSFKIFCSKKTKSLMIPYISFSFINYFYWLLFRKFSNHSQIPIYKPLIGIFYSVRDTDWTFCQGALWFIICLFVTQIVFYLIIHIFNNNLKFIIVFTIIQSIIGYIYCRYISIKLPFSIDAVLIALVFYSSGYIARKTSILTHFKYPNSKVLILLFFINLITGFVNATVSMFYGYYGNYFLFYLSAFSGIFIFTSICLNIKKSNFLTFIGKNSLVFLALHSFIIYSILDHIIKNSHYINLNIFIISFCIGLLYVIIATLILLPTSKIIDKYFPYILGKSKIEKSRQLCESHLF